MLGSVRRLCDQAQEHDAFPPDQEAWLDVEFPKYERKAEEGKGPSFIKQTKVRFTKHFDIPQESQDGVKKVSLQSLDINLYL